MLRCLHPYDMIILKSSKQTTVQNDKCISHMPFEWVIYQYVFLLDNADHIQYELKNSNCCIYHLAQ